MPAALHPPPVRIASPAQTDFPRYRLEDLGEDPGGDSLLPVALNDRGELAAVAASSQTPGAMRGYRLQDGACSPAWIAIGQEPLLAISSSGHLAGAIGVGPLTLRAWASHCGDFGSRLWPHWSSLARGVNRGGDVVGEVWCDAGRITVQCAFLVESSGASRLLSPPEGGDSIAAGINDVGMIALNAIVAGQETVEHQAWCFHAGTYVRIEGLGARHARAVAVTGAGRIIGNARTPAGQMHPFIWESGRTTDLGGIAGCECHALGGNDSGVVVGTVRLGAHTHQAFAWSPRSAFVFLSECVDAPPGWTFREARTVNARGQIAGRGLRNGRPRGFLLHPLLGA